MDVSILSLIALVLALIIACVSPKNVGVLAIAFAFIVGQIGNVPTAKIIGGFPLSLFMTLAGTTYLFGIAIANGTIDKFTKYSVKAVRGSVGILPIVLFFVAFLLSALGPGHTAILALISAPCLLLAEEVGIPVFVMAMMIGNGAQAAAMSPITPAGVIANSLAAKIGYTGITWHLFWNTFLGHAVVGFSAYCLFGGLRLWKKQDPEAAAAVKRILDVPVEPFNYQQKITMVGVLVLMVCALIFKSDVGLTAFTIGAGLTLLNAADEGKAIKAMPWPTILLICGVTVLIGLMQNVGGMALFAGFIAKVSTPDTATLVVGSVASLISVYASTSGVIMPAFIPMIPDLLAKMGGGDGLALVYTVVLAGHIVDLSSLSPSGALLFGGAGPKTDKTKFFRQLLAWGFAMVIVGSVISWLFFTVLKI
ncbi:MAG: SLC13 family permease [Negativicutes bacterium]|nr:SLC13 family permease [Negativicutes bacterium]